MNKEDSNYYDILEVNPTATYKDIIRSYQRLKIAYGKNSFVTYTGIDDVARKETLSKIEEAYLVLCCNSKRRQYDKFHKLGNDITATPEVKNKFKEYVTPRSPRFKISPAFEEEIENQTTFDGSFLKKVREYKNISLKALSQYTKISKKYFLSIENEEYHEFPATIYLRNYLMQYAQYLKLDPSRVCQSYLERLKELQTPTNTPQDNRV